MQIMKIEAGVGAADHTGTISQIALGNHDALARLYGHFAPGAFVTARRIVNSSECAQEVVCDVFIFVWRHAHTYDATRASVATWLTMIARNRAIDRWRNEGKHRFFDDRSSRDAVAVEPQDPEWLASLAQEGAALTAALATLPPLRRRVLSLAFFQGLSHVEIAEETGMPLGTVKSHVRRALSAMRETLERRRMIDARTVIRHSPVPSTVARVAPRIASRIATRVAPPVSYPRPLRAAPMS
jgi:RNA polymerase sigma factor (sigma-70 family)